MDLATQRITRRMAIIEAYRDLVDALSLLGDRVLEDAASDLPVWTQTGDYDAALTHEARAVKILQLLTYGRAANVIDGRHAETRFGLIAASERTLTQVATVNAVKRHLKEALKDLKDLQRESIAKDALDAISRAPIVREALAAARLQRLHIKQSTRKVVVLAEQPLRMGFTIARGSHVVERLSRDRAIKLATDSKNEAAVTRLQALSADIFVARHRKQAPHVRCNLTYSDKSRREGRPNQVNAYLPIFYPYTAELEPVKHNGTKVELLLSLDDDTNFRFPRPAERVDHAHPISESLGLYPYLVAS